MGDLPPRLSDQQLFVLGYLRARGRTRERLQGRLGRTRVVHGMARMESLGRCLSIVVADEFDEDGDRIKRRTPVEERIENAFERGEPQAAAFIATMARRKRHPSSRDRWLQPSHSASLSRSLSRLEDRGLITRERGDGEHNPSTVTVELTDEGRGVGDEVLDRHDDGRYSLHFDHLDEFDVFDEFDEWGIYKDDVP